jgi:nucleoid DNA-binding protein/DNA-directed RNA polymerase subunit RPC12/RpoP
MGESFTKAKLVAEIAEKANLSKAAVGRVLDYFTEIAYREAPNGFVIPGIAKLKVVTKKASRRRNPFTGQTLLIGERQALKVVPLKRAKNAIAPNENVLVQILDTPVATPTTPADTSTTAEQPSAIPAPQQPSPSAAPPSAPPAREDGQIVFTCSECGSMLAAPPSAAGQNGECPFCKAQNKIPERQPDAAANKTIHSHTAASSLSEFILFVCRACSQEIEAPADMVGMNVECPTCGTGLTVPLAESAKKTTTNLSNLATGSSEPTKNRSSMTIRIDLSDLE